MPEKMFFVSDIIASERCCYNLCLLRREYMSAAAMA